MERSPALQGVAFGVSILSFFALAWLGWGTGSHLHTDAIAPVICAGVGLHFVPLARLFGVRAYYATAAVMCLLAAVTFVLAASAPALWTMLPGIGAAITLYATCIALLAWNPAKDLTTA
ncbi:hypothetical protein EV645_6264 [Kribbella rubisoli]|uniref:Uncharacterized protein n=1 Tax=Kribbella rubisoli TaxID=3075929 RepID=A0A4V2FWU0_9ACTN|nr:hypothetical protein [Kribbella rubisoli]RZU11106.1 hypothetical protein EV645_6264 [Kribbella rubisoli]